MAKRLNARSIKSARTYTIPEVAQDLGGGTCNRIVSARKSGVLAQIFDIVWRGCQAPDGCTELSLKPSFQQANP